jgi:hypothetical protein
MKNTAYLSCRDNWDIHMIQRRRDGYIYFTTLAGVTSRLRKEEVREDIHDITQEQANWYFVNGIELEEVE